jgi:hypothetical protein
MADDFSEESPNNQVNEIVSTINAAEIFIEQNILNAIGNRKTCNPCEKFDSWKLFKIVFKSVYPNYNNIHRNIINQVQIRIWDSSTDAQKGTYKAYCDALNNEIEKIFPRMLFSGDQPEVDNTSNAQEFGDMIWDGTDIS